MRITLASAAGALSPLLLAALLPAQQPVKSSGRGALKLTTRSSEAQAAFYAGVDAAENVQLPAAAAQLRRALQLDPKLAVARAYYAAYAPGLDAAQRSEELEHAAADAMNASLGELLLVLALRAPAGAERRSLLKAAVEAVPEDPHVRYLHASNHADPRERILGFEQLNRRFPDFAPAYNLLAHVKAREMGELDAGLTIVRRYVQLAPRNPNAHNSYAELLAWAGRFDDAAGHYQQALALDPTYAAAHTGLAEVAQLKGNGAEARTHYQQAIRGATTAHARLNVRQSAAITYIMDGNHKAAVAALRTIAAEAETGGYAAVAAQAHRNLALIEAALGNKSLVHAHLRKAGALSNANPSTHYLFAAAAYAIAGDIAGARPRLKAFMDGAAASPSPSARRQAQGLAAIVEAAAGNPDAAQSAIKSAGVYGAFGVLLVAETLKKEGKTDAARALATTVAANTELDLLSVLARQRAKKL
jgi:tetratricopeptide (TPR) repeat protein